MNVGERKETMEKPNVILISADQMRVHEMGCYGGEAPPGKPNTPNIDRLASSGIRMDKAFSPNPVCTPARSCIMSGQYGKSCIGTVHNAAEPSSARNVFPEKTLAELLKGEGYDTALIGKWHIHAAPEKLGFDDCAYPKFNHLNRNQDYNINGERHIIDGCAYEFELERAREYIGKKRDRPFFLYHSISLPHMPFFDVADEFKYRYAKSETPLRQNVKPGINGAFDQMWFRIYMYDYLYYRYLGDRHTVMPDGFGIDELYAMYRGMIYAADFQVGKIMEYVENAGLAESTVIAFVSDHGDNMGSHGLYNKDCSYEEAIRVPFVVSHPGHIKPASDLDNVASLIDVAPTILDLCGIDIPGYIQGVSLAPLFGGNGKLGRDKIFIECSNGELVCRTNRYKLSVLAEYSKGGKSKVVDKFHRFADLGSDPYEMSEPDGSADYGCMKEELFAAVMEWDEQTKWMEEIRQ